MQLLRLNNCSDLKQQVRQSWRLSLFVQLFGQVAWKAAQKKKSRKTKTCSFSFINHNITKDYHVAIYIVIVANVVKIKKINLAVDSTCNDCYIYTILNKQKDKANEVY